MTGNIIINNLIEGQNLHLLVIEVELSTFWLILAVQWGTVIYPVRHISGWELFWKILILTPPYIRIRPRVLIYVLLGFEP